jgi:uncharacterized membrane protein YtjA (UPF0391 family)
MRNVPDCAALADEEKMEVHMLKWALIFLVLGLVAGALGFGGIGGAFIGIAKFLFFVALALFVIFLVLGIMAGRKIME